MISKISLLGAFFLVFGLTLNAQSLNAIHDFQFDQKFEYRNPDVPKSEYTVTYIDDEAIVVAADVEKFYPLPKGYFFDFQYMSDGTFLPVIWDSMGNANPFRIWDGTLRFRTVKGDSYEIIEVSRIAEEN